MGILFLSDGFKHIASTKPNHEDSFFTFDMGSEAGKREITKQLQGLHVASIEFLPDQDSLQRRRDYKMSARGPRRTFQLWALRDAVADY
jgi:hypothetical protein